jgi:hypothetical protein
MSLPLSRRWPFGHNIEIGMSAEGGPLARSAALRHPIHKNIRMGGGQEAGKATHPNTSTGSMAIRKKTTGIMAGIRM